MSKLLPCPFCSGQAYLTEEPQGFGVECEDCDNGTRSNNWTREKAIDLWNTRATPAGMIKTEDSHQRVIDAVTGARKSWLRQGSLPDGYKVVPVEPTEAMLNAAWDAHFCDTDGAKKIYKAMIEAAE